MLTADKYQCIRVALDDSGRAVFWPQLKGSEDYEETPLPAELGMHLITGGKVPMEFALRDPLDNTSHNYEYMLKANIGDHEMSFLRFTLTRI